MNMNKVVPPQLCLLVFKPQEYSYLGTISHSEIEVICTNLAIQRGHHLVGTIAINHR